jgi:Protein of unknown function (DUF4232)
MPASAVNCTAGGLRTGAGVARATAGSFFQVITFTNISGAACQLEGYPSAALMTAPRADAQIGAAAGRTPQAAKAVVLAPAMMASALLQIGDAGNYGTECVRATSSYLQVFPPDQTVPAYVRLTRPGCSAAAVILLHIGVVHAGTSG